MLLTCTEQKGAGLGPVSTSQPLESWMACATYRELPKVLTPEQQSKERQQSHIHVPCPGYSNQANTVDALLAGSHNILYTAFPNTSDPEPFLLHAFQPYREDKHTVWPQLLSESLGKVPACVRCNSGRETKIPTIKELALYQQLWGRGSTKHNKCVLHRLVGDECWSKRRSQDKGSRG